MIVIGEQQNREKIWQMETRQMNGGQTIGIVFRKEVKEQDREIEEICPGEEEAEAWEEEEIDPSKEEEAEEGLVQVVVLVENKVRLA